MKTLVILALVLGVVSCQKNDSAETAIYRETVDVIKDKIMHAKLDCQKALMDSEADMDRFSDDKVHDAELLAINKCITAFEDAESFVMVKSRLFDASSVKPSAINSQAVKYRTVAEHYLWAAQSYIELWLQRLVCEMLPLDGGCLEDDYACAERAETLEARSNRLWQYAEGTRRALLTGMLFQGGKR